VRVRRGAASGGNPLDSLGRNIFVDSRGTTGVGWRRVNSVLNKPGGTLCYRFFPPT